MVLLDDTKSECMAAWLLANQIHKVWKGRGHKTFVLEKPHLNLNFYYVRSFYLASNFEIVFKFEYSMNG